MKTIKYCIRNFTLFFVPAEPVGAGTLLDSTFVGMGTGEGRSAHDRSGCAIVYAGVPSLIKVGQGINLVGEHPARMWISALNALGAVANTNYKFGQISGVMAGIMK